MKESVKGKISTEFWRIFRFGVRGTVSSLIHYVIYCVALSILNPTLSYTAGYLVGLVCNYGMTTFFTFRQQPSKKNAAGFAASHALNYLLEIALLHAFFILGAGELLAPVLVMIVVVPINFLILHFVYLHKRKA